MISQFAGLSPVRKPAALAAVRIVSILRNVTRRLRDADHHRVALDEKDARQASRVRKTRFWYDDTKRGARGPYSPQKSSGLEDDPADEFAEPTAEAA